MTAPQQAIATGTVIMPLIVQIDVLATTLDHHLIMAIAPGPLAIAVPIGGRGRAASNRRAIFASIPPALPATSTTLDINPARGGRVRRAVGEGRVARMESQQLLSVGPAVGAGGIVMIWAVARCLLAKNMVICVQGTFLVMDRSRQLRRSLLLRTVLRFQALPSGFNGIRLIRQTQTGAQIAKGRKSTSISFLQDRKIIRSKWGRCRRVKRILITQFPAAARPFIGLFLRPMDDSTAKRSLNREGR